MSSRLELGPGEQVVVSTRAHASKLWRPLAVLVIAVFLHSLLQRALEVRWRPMDQPWTTVHTVLGWVVTLLLILVILLAVLRPLIRWARTRFVLTDQRLMLLGPSAPSGGVRIPLAWLVNVHGSRARGPMGSAGIGTLSADFGQAGILRLGHSPSVEEFAGLIEEKSARFRRQQGSGVAGPAPGWSPQSPAGYPPAGPSTGAAW